MKHMLHCCSRPVAVFFSAHQDIDLILDTIIKFPRTIGVTQKTMTFDTDDVWSFPDFSILFQNVLWQHRANGQDGSPSTAFKRTQSYVRQGFRDRDGVGLGFWPGDLWGRDVAIEGFGILWRWLWTYSWRHRGSRSGPPTSSSRMEGQTTTWLQTQTHRSEWWQGTSMPVVSGRSQVQSEVHQG